ncbi:thermoresistant gluconokinase [Trichoderma arundinaceum]|uniref:Gluconokinase n=1 Tax=Trichoderma arundinaceum TaxID=490622 RepID=A0A395NGN7_TRIAR|nr:thermoresistant gluconokinase [Trichoderma arundinaceum]
MMSFDTTCPVPGQKPPSAATLPSIQATTNGTSLKTASNSAAIAGRAGGHTHIWLVTGPAGCGKTSVAEYLANALDMPYIEGDSFHTPANVEKMRSGIPLTDSDRWDWLTALREESMRQINEGQAGVVLTCSALKRKYRDVIRVAAYYDHHLLIHFIYLDASEELLLQRVTQRQGHYMGANMVHSQFDILERPSQNETDVITIDVSRTLGEVQEDALARVIDMMRSDQDSQ